VTTTPGAVVKAPTPLLVRAGVVDVTSGGDEREPRGGPLAPSGNGAARERPPGVRRTRPLRAD
jgi:hypothetical protein